MANSLQQYRDSELVTDGSVVGFYEREFFMFSNFSSFQVEWKGRLWPTSEHAFQAAHYFETSPELVEQIFNARSADDAMRIAKSHWEEKVANWKDIKIAVMEDICRHKLQQHPYIQKKLLQTLDLPIVEDSPKDEFWGWGPNRDGRNELGKVWMRLREELKNNQIK